MSVRLIEAFISWFGTFSTNFLLFRLSLIRMDIITNASPMRADIYKKMSLRMVSHILPYFSKCNSFNLFLHKMSTEKHLSVFSNYVVGTAWLCFRQMKYTPFCGKMYMFGDWNSTLYSAICGILRCNMPHITMQNTALYTLKCRVLYAVKPHLAAHLCSV